MSAISRFRLQTIPCQLAEPGADRRACFTDEQLRREFPIHHVSIQANSESSRCALEADIVVVRVGDGELRPSATSGLLGDTLAAMTRALLPCFAMLGLVVASCGPLPGYSPDNPAQVTCGCDDEVSCYENASRLASAQGETAETGETLLYFAQCACFEGEMAGCNTISHFAKDYVADCEAGRDVRNSCAIAGFVHRHGVLVPQLNGRSFPPDQEAAKAAFSKACSAGAKLACP
jgi:hypothetical protein